MSPAYAPDAATLARLLAEATPGEWRVSPSGIGAMKDDHRWYCDSEACGTEADARDVVLIVAAMNALPGLLAQLAELTRERNEAVRLNFDMARNERHRTGVALRERDEARDKLRALGERLAAAEAVAARAAALVTERLAYARQALAGAKSDAGWGYHVNLEKYEAVVETLDELARDLAAPPADKEDADG